MKAPKCRLCGYGHYNYKEIDCPNFTKWQQGFTPQGAIARC